VTAGRTVGGSATPVARMARLAAGCGAERTMKRLPSCSISVSVSATGQGHGLCFVIDLLAALVDLERHEWRRIIEYQLAHDFVGALANTKDVQQVARFEFG
jgi:hypothetical protein